MEKKEKKLQRYSLKKIPVFCTKASTDILHENVEIKNALTYVLLDYKVYFLRKYLFSSNNINFNPFFYLFTINLNVQ